jgi:AcrR family transcriptional regulator
MPKTGRRPGATGTRERIVTAAQHAFGELGFDGATVRGIAREAGVDAALVHHYFGSKQQLFVASMQLPFDPGELAHVLADGGLEGLGQRIMRFAVGVWEQPASQRVMVGISRSAVTDPRAAATLRAMLESTLLPIIRDLGVDHAELRASLIWSQIVGVLFGRYIIGVRPLAEADPDELVARVGPLLQETLTGPMQP